MKFKLKIGLIALMAIGIMLAGGWWVWSNRPLPKVGQPLKLEATISTDKTEYRQGETVKITVKNNTEKEKKTCSPFYTVESFDGEKWIEIKKTLCPCEVVCRLATYIILQPTRLTEYEWEQREEWCSNPSRISTTISNQVPAGRYRIKSYIGAMKGECKEIYSSEFTIKESTLKNPQETCLGTCKCMKECNKKGPLYFIPTEEGTSECSVNSVNKICCCSGV